MFEEAVQLVCSEAPHLYHTLWRHRQAASHDDTLRRRRSGPGPGSPRLLPPPCAMRIVTVATLYGTCELRRAEVIVLDEIDDGPDNGEQASRVPLPNDEEGRGATASPCIPPPPSLPSAMRHRLMSLHDVCRSMSEGMDEPSKLFVCWVSLVDAEESCVMGQNTLIIDAARAEAGPLWEGDVHGDLPAAAASMPHDHGAQWATDADPEAADASPRPSAAAVVVESVGASGVRSAAVARYRQQRQTASSASMLETGSATHLHGLSHTTSPTPSSVQQRGPSAAPSNAVDVQALAISTSRAAAAVVTNLSDAQQHLDEIAKLCSLMEVERSEMQSMHSLLSRIIASVDLVERRMQVLERRHEGAVDVGVQCEQMLPPGRGRHAQCQTDTVVFANESGGEGRLADPRRPAIYVTDAHHQHHPRPLNPMQEEVPRSPHHLRVAAPSPFHHASLVPQRLSPSEAAEGQHPRNSPTHSIPRVVPIGRSTRASATTSHAADGGRAQAVARRSVGEKPDVGAIRARTFAPPPPNAVVRAAHEDAMAAVDTTPVPPHISGTHAPLHRPTPVDGASKSIVDWVGDVASHRSGTALHGQLDDDASPRAAAAGATTTHFWASPADSFREGRQTVPALMPDAQGQAAPLDATNWPWTEEVQRHVVVPDDDPVAAEWRASVATGAVGGTAGAVAAAPPSQPQAAPGVYSSLGGAPSTDGHRNYVNSSMPAQHAPLGVRGGLRNVPTSTMFRR